MVVVVVVMVFVFVVEGRFYVYIFFVIIMVIRKFYFVELFYFFVCGSYELVDLSGVFGGFVFIGNFDNSLGGGFFDGGYEEFIFLIFYKIDFDFGNVFDKCVFDFNNL